MRPFIYKPARDAQDAVTQASVQADAHVRAPVQLLAGGTTLIDLMKLDVMRPEALVDISASGILRCAASMRAIEGCASGRWSRWQMPRRTMQSSTITPSFLNRYGWRLVSSYATWRRLAAMYFSVPAAITSAIRLYTECNKRNPGSVAPQWRFQIACMAVLGTSEACIATYPAIGRKG